MATTHSLLESALSRAQAHRKQDLDDLIEELRIPSVSTLPERRADCLRNARWLHDRFRAIGMEAQVVDVLPNKLPVVVADSPYLPGKPHLTIYGHCDVQPPDPLEAWESAPFEPAIRHGHLGARGAADNKGNHMVTVKAVEHLVAAGGAPVNIRFLIEGEEEITGPSLPAFLRQKGKDLKTDAVLIWDGGMDEDGNPTLATALRGLLYTDLHAKGAAVDLHSGTYGGGAPNPINTRARVVGGVKNRPRDGAAPGCYDHARNPSDARSTRW